MTVRIPLVSCFSFFLVFFSRLHGRIWENSNHLFCRINSFRICLHVMRSHLIFFFCNQQKKRKKINIQLIPRQLVKLWIESVKIFTRDGTWIWIKENKLEKKYLVGKWAWSGNCTNSFGLDSFSKRYASKFRYFFTLWINRTRIYFRNDEIEKANSEKDIAKHRTRANKKIPKRFYH